MRNAGFVMGLAILLLCGSSVQQQENKRTIIGTAVSENGTPISGAKMTLTIGPPGNGRFIRNSITDAKGGYRFEGVPRGDGVLRLCNNLSNVIQAENGPQEVKPSFPIDIMKHAHIGRSEASAEFAVKVPDDATPSQTINVKLHLGATVEIVPNFTGNESIDMQEFSVERGKDGFIWGSLDTSAGPGKYVFRGFLPTQNSVGFWGYCRYEGGKNEILASVSYRIADVPIKMDTPTLQKVSVPVIDFAHQAIVGSVFIGDQEYSMTKEKKINEAGYFVGEAPELKHLWDLNSAISVTIKSESESLVLHLRPDPDGRYKIPRLQDGKYKMYAEYFLIATGKDPRYAGHIKGRWIDVDVVKDKESRVDIILPAKKPQQSQEDILNQKFSTDVEYRK